MFMKPFVLIAFCFFLLSGAAFAYAPVEMPVIKADPDAARTVEKKPRSKFVCKVSGILHCSEYGTRYKDPVYIVFDDGDQRYSAPVSEKDGEFDAALPLGESYVIRVQFKDKAAEIAKLGCPLAEGDTAKTVDIYCSGSELELIWDLRDGGGPNVDVKIKD